MFASIRKYSQVFAMVLQVQQTHARLATREWLELGHPSIGDLACFPCTALAGEGGIDLSVYPNILKWLARMEGIPGVIAMPGIPAK